MRHASAVLFLCAGILLAANATGAASASDGQLMRIAGGICLAVFYYQAIIRGERKR